MSRRITDSELVKVVKAITGVEPFGPEATTRESRDLYLALERLSKAAGTILDQVGTLQFALTAAAENAATGDRQKTADLVYAPITTMVAHIGYSNTPVTAMAELIREAALADALIQRVARDWTT